LDLLIPRIPEAESRCFIYIARRTFGFYKERDRISFSQFERGIKSKEGIQLDYGTGLSRPSIAEGLKNLDGAGAIETIKTRDGNHYKIKLEMDVEEVIKRVNQLRNLTRNNKDSQPEIVNLPNLQKKEQNKEKQSILATPSVANTAIPELIDLFKSVNPCYQRLFSNTTQRSAIERMLKSIGRDKLEWVIKILPKTNISQFAPTITTPYQLEERMGSLIAFIQKEKSRINSLKADKKDIIGLEDFNL